MKLSTTESVDGEIAEFVGVVHGNAVASADDWFEAAALVQSPVENLEVATALADAREEALWRLEARAEESGADAVIDVAFESRSIPGGGIELLAYGTGVRLDRTF